ncbi:MAG: hypothetical protein JXR68_05500 [Bacteroidales bacterium]|nr:hypothetical protein [Bacteroidales bacterium]
MENQKNFDTLDIFVYLWKKKIPIILITFVGAVASIIISLMLPNYYKATTVLFPTTFLSPSTSLLHISINQETDPGIIGNEDDLERMLQLLQSDFITNSIIQKFNLIEHYEISPDDPHLINKVKKTYQSYVSFNKTPYQGATISVIDIDPQLAADIANEISALFDTLVSEMQHQRNKEMYLIAKNAYENEVASIEILEDSLDTYRQLGILDYFKEIDRYSEGYAKAIGANTLTTQNRALFEEKFELFQKYGQEFYSITAQINSRRVRAADLHVNLIQAEQNLKQEVTHKYVISYAEKPDKKTSPKRSFIVVFATLGAFVFALAMILLLDFYKDLKIRLQNEK